MEDKPQQEQGISHHLKQMKSDKADIDSCEELVEELSTMEIATEASNDDCSQTTEDFTEPVVINSTVKSAINQENSESSKSNFLNKPISNDFERLLTLNKNIASELSKQDYQNFVTEKSDLKTKIAIKPYTEAQLSSLYTNSELEMLDQFTAQFIEAELKGLAIKQHPLYEYLTSYLQVKGKIAGEINDCYTKILNNFLRQ